MDDRSPVNLWWEIKIISINQATHHLSKRSKLHSGWALMGSSSDWPSPISKTIEIARDILPINIVAISRLISILIIPALFRLTYHRWRWPGLLLALPLARWDRQVHFGLVAPMPENNPTNEMPLVQFQTDSNHFSQALLHVFCQQWYRHWSIL